MRYAAAHDRHGFAFYPHNLPPVDGDLTFGDTSMSLEYLEVNFPVFRVAHFDENPGDPYQPIVYLTPA